MTNHDRVVGYYTPAESAVARDWARFGKRAVTVRRKLEAAGVDVAARLKALGIEDAAAFDDPWAEAQPQPRKRPRKK